MYWKTSQGSAASMLERANLIPSIPISVKPVLFLHLEEAISNIYALQQVEESEGQFAARVFVMQHQNRFRGQAGRPLSIIESISIIPIVESHDVDTEKMISLQVKQKSVERILLNNQMLLADKFAKRVTYQHMQNQNLNYQGHS